MLFSMIGVIVVVSASIAGVPGYPGSPDLTSCLRRIRPATDPHETPLSPMLQMPYGFRTPDSIMATGKFTQSKKNEYFIKNYKWLY